MNEEIIRFWQRNNTPVSLMAQKAPVHDLVRQQVEVAARIVYEEVQEIIENVSEIRPYMNGNELERIILFRNLLKPNILGWRVFEVGKCVQAHKHDSEIIKLQTKVAKLEKLSKSERFFNWLKSFNWELDPWQ